MYVYRHRVRLPAPCTSTGTVYVYRHPVRLPAPCTSTGTVYVYRHRNCPDLRLSKAQRKRSWGACQHPEQKQGKVHLLLEMAAPPPPGQPRPHRRLRARARGPACSPSERPRRACARRTGGLRLFEQEGGHISRSQRCSPHPPGVRLRDSPFPQPGRSPSQELPHQRPHGAHGRLPHRPALQPVSPSRLRAADLALPLRTQR
ncbi:hypothetical protein LEMLEM_LOCUS7166 [Lemmus lemmus]